MPKRYAVVALPCLVAIGTGFRRIRKGEIPPRQNFQRRPTRTSCTLHVSRSTIVLMQEFEPQRGVSPGVNSVLSRSGESQQTALAPDQSQTGVNSYPNAYPVQGGPSQLHAAARQMGPEYNVQAPVVDTPDEPRIRWTSPALSHKDKDSAWFGAYVLGAIIIGALVFLFTRDIISTIVVFVAAGLLLYSGARRPADLNYSLGEGFLLAGRKLYRLQDFKAFSTDEQPTGVSITFWPLKRFMPVVTVFVSHEQMQMVVDRIEDYLPSEPHKNDAIDRILRRIQL